MLILVVDDSYQNRKLISAQLENGHRKIYTASNGVEALEILANTEVDLIISDILMPQMDGYQFCSQVRQNDKFKHIPIIIYTATYTSDSDEKLSFDLGADAFLKKPAGLKLLEETVTKLLQNPRSKRNVKGLVMDSAPLRQYNHRLVEKLEEKNFELRRRSEELGYEIEERRRAERLNREGEELFKELTDAIHEVFWMTSLSKNEIVYISQGYEQIWGRSTQSLLENPISWIECIHPDDRDRVFDSARTKQVTGEYREEYRIIRPDGEIRWIRDKAFPVKNEKGDTIRVAGIAEDITEYKLKEAQLKEVEKRRAELEEQLIQAQKLESLGTLASGIAHDFNNILSIIMGHTSVIENNRNNPEKFSQHVSALHMATQRGASLVRQLLTFARKTEFNLELAQINDIILEISKLISQTFPKNIRLFTNFQEDLPLVKVDTNQIHQVLLNLCVNARDAMQEGGILSIETFLADIENLKTGHSKSLAEKYVVLRISDSGSGMSEKTKQRIFEPFFTTKDIGKGTGLGLALAYSVIDNHKGWIEVDSELGRGTTFFVYLPVPKEKSEINLKPIYLEPESLGGQESILVIEDEELLRDMLKDLLESKGYKVYLAVDGEDGVEQFLLRHSQIKLVMTDLGLPKFGGSEVIKRIRAIHSSVKIVLASGFMEPELKLSLKDYDVSYFIQKPYLGTEILSCIRSALDQE
ncbi:hybrid sensor histidine kinase/response regulator [Leptospira hartskeerlii]|uniref:histidine kinase n=1 Tax=Leptospira hartskeerlii TaxID=2023177 RepID=A0A2M9X8V3_9LEPT|nr:response regulator [Leptospira hartskeerlii]PJZ24029.1 hybrid sensor histidine kinase/response regulator [Leptospira hartskeerlii]PJZ32095.1 hybrid sensor histidine kinase/response regulator [Leptospira hartskeerlii]